MDCGEEVSLLRARLSRVAGVRELRFDVVLGRMEVEYAPAKVTPEAIESAVASVGMRCEPWREAQTELVGRDWGKWLVWGSGVSLAAGMTLQVWHGGDWVTTLLAHEHGAGGHSAHPGSVAMYALAILAGAALAARKAWAALLTRRPDMNLLVVISMAGAAGLGEWTEAGTLAFLFSLAGRLEARSLLRAREEISKLLRVMPAEASVVHGDHEHRVEVEAVQVGSLVRVREGEQIPCDGVVERGASYVNQSLITGESEAVERRAGDEVFAGTLNESGVLEIRAAQAGRNTTLRRMLRMVGDSRSRKAPSEQFVERFTRHYTPAVLLMAISVALLPPMLGAGSWGHWVYQGMVVLLIACPCALVISTPVSVAAALTSAAREGVLVKGGAYLEEAARVKVLALDRQGVLTRGMPEVAREVNLNGDEERSLRAWEEWRAEEGGSFPLTPRWAEEGGLAGSVRSHIAEMTAEGWTVEARRGRDGVSLVGLCDRPQRDAREVVAALRKRGIRRVVVATGDPEPTAREVAELVQAEDVHAELLAEEKAALIEGLMREHRHVAMVGDTAADALALTAASLGISMGVRGEELARESADVVLMRSDLKKVLFLVDHARRTLKVVRQNIAFALVMKGLFLAAAVAGWATLWMAVAADMGATFAVTLNGLRLLRTEPHQEG